MSYLFSESDRPYAAAVSFTGLGGSQETTSVAVRLLVNDHGDVVALADETGETFARYDYGAFGEDEGVTTRATGLLAEAEAAFIADFQPLRYASYCYDTWSGHHYLQARYYDPVTKQFLSKDPAKSDGEERVPVLRRRPGERGRSRRTVCADCPRCFGRCRGVCCRSCPRVCCQLGQHS